MTILSGLTNQSAQVSQLQLEDGTLATLTLNYRPNQIGWFYDLGYADFELNGQRLVTSPNCLYQFQNLIPFGLACVTVENSEPLTQNAFSDGTSVLVLLTPNDIVAQQYTVFGGF